MRVPVCVFAKPPVAGMVKTRLAAVVGAEAAAELAAAMLLDTWDVLGAVEGVRPVLAATETGPFPEELADAEMWLQGPGDLGARMEAILRRGLEEAPMALVLGADTPSLQVRHITVALNKLQQEDAVLGPAADGGFYLLGVRRCSQGLLAELPWSCSHTGAATAERLRGLDYSIGMLETLADVDVVEDVRALRPAEVGERTKAWLASSFRR